MEWITDNDTGIDTNGSLFGNSSNVTGPVRRACCRPQIDYDTQNLIWIIFTSVVIPVGTVGNLLAIAVLLKKKNRRCSTAIYLLALAVSDLVILWAAAFRFWFMSAWNYDIRHDSVASCRVHVFLVYTSIQFSSWMLVLVTLERVISIKLPHRVRVISTRRVAGLVIGSILTVLLLLNIHFLLYRGAAFIEVAGFVQQCVPLTPVYRDFNEYVWPWVDLCVYFFAPFALLIAGNAVIAQSIWKSKRNRMQMRSGQSQTKGHDDGVKSLTVMLILLGSVFFISQTPASVYFIGFPYWVSDPNLTIAKIERILLVHTISNCMLYINCSTNFYLYCLSGPRFRGDVVALVCCKDSGSTDGVFGHSRQSSTNTTLTTAPRSSTYKVYSNDEHLHTVAKSVMTEEKEDP